MTPIVDTEKTNLVPLTTMRRNGHLSCTVLDNKHEVISDFFLFADLFVADFTLTSPPTYLHPYDYFGAAASSPGLIILCYSRGDIISSTHYHQYIIIKSCCHKPPLSLLWTLKMAVALLLRVGWTCFLPPLHNADNPRRQAVP